MPAIFDFEHMAASLVDDISDAMFVCDAVTSEIIYINETACNLINKQKSDCLGSRCYNLFWNRCKNCDRCVYISEHQKDFYEETTMLNDKATSVHIKAKMDEWDGKKVKIHYLQNIVKV